MSEISPHGLRHWFASAAAEMNYSDFVIGGMLAMPSQALQGGTRTRRIVRSFMAADRVSQRLAGALDGRHVPGC